MKFDQANEIAGRVKAQLAPYCDRIEIAGSVRRRKADVGDIEVVCVPKTVSMPDLFGTGAAFRDKDWSLAVVKIGRVEKGDVFKGRYIQIEHPAGIKVDIFTAHPDNWGLIYAIRTGSADYSHCVLACGWVRNGYKSADGMLWRDGVAVPVREERDLFRMAGVPWVEPEARNLHSPNKSPSAKGRE